MTKGTIILVRGQWIYGTGLDEKAEIVETMNGEFKSCRPSRKTWLLNVESNQSGFHTHIHIHTQNHVIILLLFRIAHGLK